MGVASSREIEEQLEAALALLDAARSKQEAMRSENDALQARITAQAASLLLHEDARGGASVHLVQERQPLSKRIVFSMGVVVPLAMHQIYVGLGLEEALQYVHVSDATAVVRAVLLLAIFALLLRFRRYKWRRIRPERIVRERSGSLDAGGQSPRAADGRVTPRASLSEPPPEKKVSALLASEEELAVLGEVKEMLWQLEPRPPLLPEHEPLLDVQLIRLLREHGPNKDRIYKHYMRALEWRQKNLPKEIPATEDPLAWLPSRAMVNGEWACQFAYLGLHCGKSKIGCPVKIERLGRYDLQGLQESDPDNFRKKFNDFYLCLIEFLQTRLDLLSLEEGRLVQTYEVFDLQGLGYNMVNMTVINFTKDILMNYAACYPQSFRKAAVINAPSWLPRIWRMVSYVLPQSVKAKVKILGNDYYAELQEDLGDEALAWCECSPEDLVRAPFKEGFKKEAGGGGGGGGGSSAEEPPLDGGPVVVEEDDS